jgi:hypothetical protein
MHVRGSETIPMVQAKAMMKRETTVCYQKSKGQQTLCMPTDSKNPSALETALSACPVAGYAVHQHHPNTHASLV